MKQIKSDTRTISERLDTFLTHRVFGYVFFFAFMFIMFQVTFSWGKYPQQAIEFLIDQFAALIHNILPHGILKDLIVDGIIGGVGGVIVFLPNILLLYFFISIMEESGYMARAAYIMDKIMHKMGLHGQSFIPLIMGFGCNVPAILSSRAIKNKKSQLVTVLVNPLMSCSARLPVYLLLVGAFFPEHASVVLFTIYLVGIILAIILARLFSHFLVKNDHSYSEIHLPKYRIPEMRLIAKSTWEKGEQYLRKMGGAIMVASILIWALGYFPHNDSFSTIEQQEYSYIGAIGKAIEPLIAPIGFDWQLGIGLLSGIGAKELIVSTLGVLSVHGEKLSSEAILANLEISPLVSLCFMLFVLIYFPCIATLAAIKQELNSWKWTLFSALYTTALAWIVAYTVFKVGSLLGF